MIDATLHSERLILRPLEPEDAPKLLQYVMENRKWLTPWEPSHPHAYFTLEGQGSILKQNREDRRNENGVLMGIFENGQANGALRGRLGITGIIRGIWQNGFVGYSIAEESAGKGYMTEALKRLVFHGFEGLELHRLQASIIPRNKASLRVLEKCKFRYEGRALRYLKINEVWEDHDIFALTAEDIKSGLY